MTDADQGKFAGLMGTLCEAYRTPLTPGMLRTYWYGLIELDFTAVETAAYEATKTCEHFPTVAQIRKARWGQAPEVPKYKLLDGPRPNAEHAKASFALINRIRAERMPIAEQVAEFERMEREFPGHGWGSAAKQQAAWGQRTGRV